MSYFTLIYGDQVRRGTTGKIVPADEFSKLTDGRQLLEAIREDAEKYRHEVISECEKIKEEAERAGFEEGLKRWSEQLALLEEEIETIHDQVKKAVVPLALQATKKVIGRELEIHPQIVAEIVANALRGVASHRKVKIFCNRQDLEILETSREQLKAGFERVESFAIQERSDIAPGGVVIETEAGIINAQLETQLRALETAFEAFLNR